MSASLLPAMVLFGCRDTASRHNPYPVGSRNWAKEYLRRFTYETPAFGQDAIASLPERDCEKLGETRFLSGVWLNNMEGSQLIEGASTAAQANAVFAKMAAGRTVDNIWLEADRHTLGLKLPVESDGAAYAITMLGRVAPRRPKGWGYGHLGMSSGLIVAHYILTLKRLN